MRRSTSALALVLLVAGLSAAQDIVAERGVALLHRCEEVFGSPYTMPNSNRAGAESRTPQRRVFRFNASFVITVTQSPDGALEEIELAPQAYLEDRELTDGEKRLELTSGDEAAFLHQVDALKALGKLVREAGLRFSSGPSTNSSAEYEHAFVSYYWRDVLLDQRTHTWAQPLQTITVTFEQISYGKVEKKTTDGLVVSGEEYPVSKMAFDVAQVGDVVRLRRFGCVDSAVICVKEALVQKKAQP